MESLLLNHQIMASEEYLVPCGFDTDSVESYEMSIRDKNWINVVFKSGKEKTINMNFFEFESIKEGKYEPR